MRDDLLRLVPEAETCSTVLPDIVSPEFRPTPRPKESVAEAIALRECPISLHRPRTNLAMRIRRLMADDHLDRYIMAVSTLEPGCDGYWVPTAGSSEYGLTQIETFDLGNVGASPSETAIVGAVQTVYANGSTMVLAGQSFDTIPSPQRRGLSSTAASPVWNPFSLSQERHRWAPEMNRNKT